MNGHVVEQALSYAEGRLSPRQRGAVEAHLAVCPTCRAQVDDLRSLSDTLSAVPPALDTLSRRRTRGWAAVWPRVAGSYARLPAGRRDWRRASAMVMVALAMFSVSLLISPVRQQAIAASGPAVALIETPLPQTSELTHAASQATVTVGLGSTATLALGPGQTPAPIPNP